MEYKINTESNKLDWLNKGTWYNRNISSKSHGIRFDGFITQARTDRYNLMCSLVAHDRLQPDYEDYESSIGDRVIPNDATIKILEALGATFNFIYIWLKLLRENYCNAMKEVFIQIPQNVEIALTPKEKSKNY